MLVVVQNLPFELDRRVRTECAELLKAGYRVSVICPKRTDDEPDRRAVDGVAVFSYQSTGATTGVASYLAEFAICWLRTARLTVRVAREEGFAVLQACNPPDTFWLLGWIWRVANGTRFVYDQHDLCPEVYQVRFRAGDLLHRALLFLERMTYRTADHVISPNPAYQRIALDRGRVPADRTTVVMSTPDAATMVRGEVVHGLRHGRRHLACYVGVMGPQDGVEHLVDAIAYYVHGLGRTDCHTAFLGFGDSLPAVRQRAHDLGLDEWVTFTGQVSHTEISRWLSTAAVGITPDPPNAFNDRSTMNKTLEYMAHGVPVISTDLAETRRCAGEAATYTDGTKPEELARALARLLDDPASRRRMGRIGRARIERDLSWTDQARAYVSAIDRVVGRNPGPARVPRPSQPIDGRPHGSSLDRAADEASESPLGAGRRYL